MFRTVISQARKQVARLNNVRYLSQEENLRYTPSEVNEASSIEKCVNNVTLLGRVGTEPQKRGSAEHPVVIFSLATHTNYKYEAGEFMQRTDWHRICVFKPNLRDTVYKYLKKGKRAMINGRISYNEVTGADGNVSTSTSIIADDVIFFQ
ncbi:PREDICTED: single-stranded DNA-binding protein, mitochondrial [Wasmannia auropunctata]|uniref:single-stranded DNA-binding protein, mitochondrial n=1 Tax=Wasmannia auropunctata TaxID=64793 RepID=UPI0005EEBC1C|nr:PREDICTED: single-stranded DNA-binding protein, mitochondrial [Wasmannia auropunctata]